MPPGSYWHRGLALELKEFIKRTKINPSSPIELAIGIDGLPLSRSSTNALWPILCCVIPSEDVFIIGAYHGYSKPQDANIFLEDLFRELTDLIENGLSYDNQVYNVVLKHLICDAPAKSFVLKVKNHTGYSSCTKCITEGEYRDNRVCFPDIYAPKRTDADFLQHKDENYHTGHSILENLPNFGPVSNVPLDYSHLACLGVMRKMLYSLVGGDLTVRLKSSKIQELSAKLENEIKQCIPCEFVRKPRSLQFLKQWKATEFRQFLLYTGPVALASIVSNDLYNHFLSLHVAMRILCSASFVKDYLSYAQDLLNHSVKCYKIFYGDHHVSHNVHGLIHLCSDVENFGPLDNFSALKFENFMQCIKHLIRKSDKPLQQLSNRYSEAVRHSFEQNEKRNSNPKPEVDYEHYGGPLLEDCTNPQYKQIKCSGYTFKINNRANSCCGLRNGKIIQIENIAYCRIRKCLVIIGREYKEVQDLFETPCSSSIVDVYVVGKLSCNKVWSVSDIDRKFVVLPFSKTKVTVSSLLHKER